jgi:hypothetical protein
MNAVRSGAAWLYRILISIFAVLVPLQFFFAGAGIFRAEPGEGESVSHDTFEDKFELHAATGHLLFIPGVFLLLIFILIAWTGPRSIGATVGLGVLLFIQILLPSAGDWIAALHPVNALLILFLTWFLAWRAWRGNLLIPPSRLAAPAGPATPR